VTIQTFIRIIKDNNIPEDVKMLSDSGWECDATDMDGVYYNETNKEIVFTQFGDKYENPYYSSNEWKLLYSKESRE